MVQSSVAEIGSGAPKSDVRNPVKQRGSNVLSRLAVWIALSWALVAAPAFAQLTSWGVDEFTAPPDDRWAAVAAADVEAAYRLIRDNHPGASVELHDDAFRRGLEDAHRIAAARAKLVTSYQGYSATLAGFATALGDKHIWSRPTLLVNIPRWAGVIVSRRGSSWVVTDTAPEQKDLLGAAVIACDGRSADAIAATYLGGFKAVWTVEAQRIQTAPWLLIDEGNPFVARPQTCDFEVNAVRHRETLDWRRIKRDDLIPRLRKAVNSGLAGFGVRQVGEGFWISVQTLDDRAPAVVAAVRAQQDRLRGAAFVVIDVRGNGGGSSDYGREIATALMGHEAVAARLGSEEGASCGGPDGAWRASAGNVRNLEFLIQRMGDPETKVVLTEQLRQVKAAAAGGRAFSGPVQCAAASSSTPAKIKGAPASLMKGPLILITDSACFSSCLVVTNDLRDLGAFQVGQTTDAATHFTEVREEYLPSGYSMFSTLQAVAPDAPLEIGPFAPRLAYGEDMADTAALEEWVSKTAYPAATAEARRRRADGKAAS